MPDTMGSAGPSKEDALKEAIDKNAALTAAFPNAGPAVQQSNALAKSLTPAPGVISEQAASTGALGLNPSDTQIAHPTTPPYQTTATIPPITKQAPTIKQMVQKVSTPISPGANDTTAVGGQDYRALTAGSPSSPEGTGPAIQNLAQKAKDSPTFADMLKKIGFNVANLVQSAAYGATGNTSPTLQDVKSSREFELKKAKAQADIAAQQNQIEQQYAMDRLGAQSKFQSAQNKEQAKLDYDKEMASIEAQHQARLSEIRANPMYNLQKTQAQQGAIDKSLGSLGLGQ